MCFAKLKLKFKSTSVACDPIHGRSRYRNTFILEAHVIDQAELYQGTGMERFISIQEVSAMTGLPKSTLRYWEKEFSGFISPLRTPGGHRRYSEQHCQLFDKIKLLKQQGKKIVEIKQIFIQRKKPECDFQSSANDNVERLARRIAELVNEEVNRYLSGHESTTQTKSGVAK